MRNSSKVTTIKYTLWMMSTIVFGRNLTDKRTTEKLHSCKCRQFCFFNHFQNDILNNLQLNAIAIFAFGCRLSLVVFFFSWISSTRRTNTWQMTTKSNISWDKMGARIRACEHASIVRQSNRQNETENTNK